MKILPHLLALALCAPAWLLAQTPDDWRREHRIIDMHMHIDGTEERFARAIRIMDGAGIGCAPCHLRWSACWA